MLKLQIIVGSTRPGRNADPTQVLVPFVTSAFDTLGNPSSPAMTVGLNIVLEDLAWLGAAMKTARAGGQPLPPGIRMRAAMAAK